ncbi:unnamed protein product [Prunus brigantina]
MWLGDGIPRHTFTCSWGEFTPTLEDVANIFHLPLCGSQDAFHIALSPEDELKLEALRKGALTSPSTSLRFSNWIQFLEMLTRMSHVVLQRLRRYGLGNFSPDESISQGAENTLPTPTLGMSSVAADTAMRLPVTQPHAPPLLGTSDTAAGTAPQLPAVLLPTPSRLGTRDTAADTSPQFPAVLPPTSSCLGTPDTVADTSPQFPAVLPHTPCLGTPDTAADTSPQFPAGLPPTPPCLSIPNIASDTPTQLSAVLPRGEIIDDSHKNSDALTSIGHLSEKNMFCRDWENSFIVMTL